MLLRRSMTTLAYSISESPERIEFDELRYSASGAWKGQSVVITGSPRATASTATRPTLPGINRMSDTLEKRTSSSWSSRGTTRT
ncbi:hypothetical protein DEJ32_09875 [Curtobacterium sp. MCPF17_046]|nr:hypothetical protein DEJ32_09875 [Curtobacterium sp. MCPF17_046]